jgi:hypothetical protein
MRTSSTSGKTKKTDSSKKSGKTESEAKVLTNDDDDFMKGDIEEKSDWPK